MEKRFRCLCGGSMFRLYTEDDKFTAVECKKCGKKYGTRHIEVIK